MWEPKFKCIRVPMLRWEAEKSSSRSSQAIYPDIYSAKNKETNTQGYHWPLHVSYGTHVPAPTHINRFTFPNQNKSTVPCWERARLEGFTGEWRKTQKSHQMLLQIDLIRWPPCQWHLWKKLLGPVTEEAPGKIYFQIRVTETHLKLSKSSGLKIIRKQIYLQVMKKWPLVMWD